MEKIFVRFFLFIAIILTFGIVPAIFWHPFMKWRFLSGAEHGFMDRLEQEISHGRSSISLASLTDFPWDQLCIYDYAGEVRRDLDRGKFTLDNANYRIFLESLDFWTVSDVWIVLFILKNRIVEIFYVPSGKIKLNDETYELGGYQCHTQKTYLKIEQNGDSKLLEFD